MAEEAREETGLVRRTSTVKRYAIPGAVGVGTAGLVGGPAIAHLVATGASDVAGMMPGLTPHVVEGGLALLIGTTIAGTVRAGSSTEDRTMLAAGLPAIAAVPAAGVLVGLAAHSTGGAIGGGIGGLVVGAIAVSSIGLNMNDNHPTPEQSVTRLRRIAIPTLVAGAVGVLGTVGSLLLHQPDVPVAEAVAVIGLGASVAPTIGWASSRRAQRQSVAALGE